MNNGHLAVPGSSDSSASQDNHFIGRPRSDSTRSRRSQGSQGTGPSSSLQTADYTRRPSIRLRGFSGIQESSIRDVANSSTPLQPQSGAVEGGITRTRSISAPQPIEPVGITTNHTKPSTNATIPVAAGSTISAVSSMPIVLEASPDVSGNETGPVSEPRALPTPNELIRSSWLPRRRARSEVATRDFANDGQEYESNLVDYLDTIDPEVQTLNTLNNVQNSLFVPDLGRYLNRRPTYTLTRRPSDIEEQQATTTAATEEAEEKVERTSRMQAQRIQSNATLASINSHVNEKYYAVLPHGVTLLNWTEEEKLELNDHVRHMLHSRRSKFKRSMKGFGQYVRKPLGAFVTIYATLITLFGLAWVLFLIGWINVGGRQLYIINIIDNILVALFAIIGDGLAPFRTVDTYHMIFIAHYHHLTWRLRREKQLPKLEDQNDLPPLPSDADISDPEKQQTSVLTEEQQRKLAHHQAKFSKSHSFYKPHETTTHHAFPLRLLVAIVVLLDCHSLLQIALGACTWSIYYKRRPFALTTVILCCSITCNITAGILITVGDRKTRKKDVLERMERQELTRSAIKKVEKHRERQSMDLIREQHSERQSMDVDSSRRPTLPEIRLHSELDVVEDVEHDDEKGDVGEKSHR